MKKMYEVKKRNERKMVKAQVTIFIILALIIVVSIILVFLLIQGPEAEPGGADERDPQNYIESCVKDSLKEVVQILAKQGGYVNPLEYKIHEGDRISYLCYNDEIGKECVVLESDLKLNLEKEIDKYLKQKIDNCFQILKTTLEEKDYIVKMDSMDLMNFETKLEPGKVIVDINRKFEMRKRGSLQKVEDFNIGYIYPLRKLSFHTMKIISNEASLGNCYNNQHMQIEDYSINNYPLEISKIDVGNGDDIYILNLNQYEFKFAIRGCVNL